MTGIEQNDTLPEKEVPPHVHKILRNGLAIYGLIEHFTEEQLQKYIQWVAARL